MFSLGDVLDAKASIGLVIVTFLAIQTADFLKVSGPGDELQFWSAVALAVAGALALAELWPRNYQTETPESLTGWLQELRDYYQNDAEAEKRVTAAFTAGLRDRTVERLDANSRLNRRKSTYMTWCYRFTTVAFALNLVTLLLRAAS
jgi:hypothetical protein